MKKVVGILITIVILSASIYLYLNYGHSDNKDKSENTENNNVENNNVENSTNNKETDAIKFKKEYEALNLQDDTTGITVNIDENNQMVYKTITEILDIIKNKTGIVYFGFPSCPWCRNAVPMLLETIKEYEISEVYYLNTRNLKEEEQEYFTELKAYLVDYLETNENGEKTFYVPDIYFIKDGEIVGHHISTLSSQTSPYIPLDESQQEELKNIYRNYINLMLN